MIIPDSYGTIAHRFVFGASGEQCVITHGIHNTPTDDAITVATGVTSAWLSYISLSLLSDQWTYIGAYALINIGGVMQSGEDAVSDAGTETLAPVSPAVALGVKKQTSYAGKKYRGRFYLPSCYLPESKVTGGGVVDSSWVSSFTTALENYREGLSTAGYPMYLLHNDTTVPTPVNELIVRSNVRTQRRRQKLS